MVQTSPSKPIFVRLKGTLRHDALYFIPLVVHQPGKHVDLMDGCVCYGHGCRVAVRDAVRAVRAFYNHRRAEFTGIQELFHLSVSAVIAAHESDLYKMLSGSNFRVDHFLAAYRTVIRLPVRKDMLESI